MAPTADTPDGESNVTLGFVAMLHALSSRVITTDPIAGIRPDVVKTTTLVDVTPGVETDADQVRVPPKLPFTTLFTDNVDGPSMMSKTR